MYLNDEQREVGKENFTGAVDLSRRDFFKAAVAAGVSIVRRASFQARTRASPRSITTWPSVPFSVRRFGMPLWRSAATKSLGPFSN